MASSPSPRPRSAPFSAHARGVPLFDRARLLDAPRAAARALLDLRDVGSSLFWFLSMQSWLALWAVLITVLSLCFFFFYDDAALAAPLDWAVVGFAVVLPLTLCLWAAFGRRDRCLDLLSEAKCLALSILDAHAAWPSGAGGDAAGRAAAAAEARGAAAAAAAAARAYFQPGRFYARAYPYLGYRAALVQIALDRARHQRALRAALGRLDAAAAAAAGAGLPPALAALLHERGLRLAVALDSLANVKEFGTPQGVRAAARCYVCLVVPLFMGPYWAWVGTETDFAFAFFHSTLMELALVGVLAAAMALEDPFDNAGLGGVFVDEALWEVEAAAGAAGGGGGGGGGGSPRRVVRVETETV